VVDAHCAACTKQSFSANVLRDRTRLVAIAALLCSIAFVGTLHIARPDLAPVSHRLSEYANGSFGWMMTAAFVTLGFGMVALGLLLRTSADARALSRLIPIAAVLAGVGMIFSGLFRTGVSPMSEAIHSRASGIATVLAVAIALAYSLPRSRRAALRRDIVGAGLALAAATLAAVSPLLHDTHWTGLSQRTLWLVVMAWLLWAAWHPPYRSKEEALRPETAPPTDQELLERH
jgi:hypothetical protein